MSAESYREKVVEAAAMRQFVQYLYLAGGQISLFAAYQKLEIEPPLLARAIADLQSAGVLDFVDGDVKLGQNWRLKLIAHRKLLALKKQRNLLDWIPTNYRAENLQFDAQILPKEWRLSSSELFQLE